MWWGVVKDAPPPENNHFFIPKNDKFWCILTQFLTCRKRRQALEALGHGFYRSIAKESSQKQRKNDPKVLVRLKGGGVVTPSSPPPNTPRFTLIS